MYGFHNRLHPGICYSHPSSSVSPPPPLRTLSAPPSEGELAPVLLQFDVEHGSSCEWRYPFDLCAGTYRLGDVVALLRDIHDNHGPGAIRNPNVYAINSTDNSVLKVLTLMVCWGVVRFWKCLEMKRCGGSGRDKGFQRAVADTWAGVYPTPARS